MKLTGDGIEKGAKGLAILAVLGLVGYGAYKAYKLFGSGAFNPLSNNNLAYQGVNAVFGTPSVGGSIHDAVQGDAFATLQAANDKILAALRAAGWPPQGTIAYNNIVNGGG